MFVGQKYLTLPSKSQYLKSGLFIFFLILHGDVGMVRTMWLC